MCTDSNISVRDLGAMYAKDRKVKYATILRYVTTEHLAEIFGGYYWGRKHNTGRLRLANDYAVCFYMSKFRGRKCVHIDHSMIDHIFFVF